VLTSYPAWRIFATANNGERKGAKMDAWHQLMLDREQHLQEALLRAESNKASEKDWEAIYFECGLKRKTENEPNRC
jgi:hypothetical protein